MVEMRAGTAKCFLGCIKKHDSLAASRQNTQLLNLAICAGFLKFCARF
jgi:hypothetical protein